MRAAAVVDYYEAARIAYKNGYYMSKYIDSEIKDVDKNKAITSNASLNALLDNKE